MTTLLKINDTTANKISYYHLALFLASLPFNLFYSHLILVSYALNTLIHLDKKQVKPLFTLKMAALTSVFLITVFSTIYSVNKREGFNEWGKQLTILIFPVLFCLNPLDLKKYKHNLLLIFALVCTASVVYLFADALITIKHYGLPLTNIFSPAFTNHNFSEPIEMHATFFSMQVMLAIAVMFFTLSREKSFFYRCARFICITVLTAGLIELSSKTIFLVFLVIVNISVPWLLLKGGIRLKFVLCSISFSGLIVFGLLHSGAFRERFVNELKFDIAQPKPGEVFDGRMARWEATTALIVKKPLIGYGAGSEIGLLQESFYQRKLYDSYLNKLNTHNEYLSITLKSGIIGLLIYITTLAFGFKIAIQKRDIIFLTFITLIAIVSFAENLLDVDKGIIFYAFFFPFFIFSTYERERTNFREMRKPTTKSVEDLVLNEA